MLIEHCTLNLKKVSKQVIYEYFVLTHILNHTAPGHGAGPWGDYRSCDTPPKTFENMLEHINKTFADKVL